MVAERGERDEGWIELEEFGRVREGGGFHGGVGEALGGKLVAREGRVGGESGVRGAESADFEVVEGGAWDCRAWGTDGTSGRVWRDVRF